jgi:hypothetical protein
VEKFCSTRQATDDDITGHMRFTYWIIRATGTHSESEILLFFHGNNGQDKVPQYYF